jgi:hypothetical protein
MQGVEGWGERVCECEQVGRSLLEARVVGSVENIHNQQLRYACLAGCECELRMLRAGPSS